MCIALTLWTKTTRSIIRKLASLISFLFFGQATQNQTAEFQLTILLMICCEFTPQSFWHVKLCIHFFFASFTKRHCCNTSVSKKRPIQNESILALAVWDGHNVAHATDPRWTLFSQPYDLPKICDFCHFGYQRLRSDHQHGKQNITNK